MAPEPSPGSHSQKHPHTPIVLHWYAAGTGRRSIEHVFPLDAAPVVVLPLPLSCLYIRVERLDTSSARQRKSAKASWTPLESVILLPQTWKRASYI